MIQKNLPKKPEKKPENKIEELNPKEAELIRLIREKYRFGRIVVIVHEGIPQRIEQTVEYHAL